MLSRGLSLSIISMYRSLAYLHRILLSLCVLQRHGSPGGQPGHTARRGGLACCAIMPSNAAKPRHVQRTLNAKTEAEPHIYILSAKEIERKRRDIAEPVSSLSLSTFAWPSDFCAPLRTLQGAARRHRIRNFAYGAQRATREISLRQDR